MNNLDIYQRYYNFGKKVGWWRRGGAAFKYYAKFQLFKDINISGLTMLDVGCGSGIYSIYAAMNGIKEVTGLEPSVEGSRGKEAVTIMEKGIDQLGLTNVNIEKVKFQDFNPGNKKFDIILLAASINHINEPACIRLLDDQKCWKTYCSIAKKIRSIISENGYLLVRDCSRRIFFGDLNIKNPVIPIILGQKPSKTIEWEKHQQPEVWAKLFLESGFRDPKIRWISDSRLMCFGFWQRNRLISYFGKSSFLLVMRSN